MTQPTRQFAFRLCLALHVPHPDYLLQMLTSRQFAEWLAFFGMMPFGQEYSDYVVASVGAALWNQQRGKNVEPIRPSDLLPRPPQDTDEIKTALRRAIGHGCR